MIAEDYFKTGSATEVGGVGSEIYEERANVVDLRLLVEDLRIIDLEGEWLGLVGKDRSLL